MSRRQSSARQDLPRSACTCRLCDARGLGAMAVIVALLIAALLYFGYFKVQSAMSEKGTTTTAVDATRAFACRTNRQTIERMISMWQVNHPGEAPTFAALESEGQTIPSCPEGGRYALADRHVRCSEHE